MDPLPLALEAAAKALVYAAVMLSVGSCVARMLLCVRVAGRLTPENATLFESALARLLLLSTVALVAALTARAWAHTAASFGVADAFSWEPLHLIAWESQWGASWQLQMGGALTLAVCAWSVRRWPQAGWTLAAAGAAALCFLLPLIGHAAGEPDRVLLHGSHILGGGIWLGTLTAAVMASRVATRADAPPAFAPPAGIQMLRHFSPVAFTGSSLLAVTGAVAVWWYLGSVGNAVTTTYGRLLLLKLILVGAAAMCGFLNWRRLRALAQNDAGAAHPVLVTVEIALAVTIVLVTAVLTETEHP